MTYCRGTFGRRRTPSKGLSVEPDVAIVISAQDLYEVRVRDTGNYNRLVAAVELVSPRNKDGFDAQRNFVAKCLSYLREQICVVLVDVVTSRTANLHAELIRDLGTLHEVPPMDAGALYATVYCNATSGSRWQLDVWSYELTVGSVMPTVPLWIAHATSVPIDLEATFNETRRLLRM